MTVRCPQCGEFGEAGTGCPSCGTPLSDPDEPAGSLGNSGIGNPWDRREEIGALRAYGQTLRSILLSPKLFFAALEGSRTLWGPFLFGFATSLVGSLFNLGWQVVFFQRNWLLQTLFSESGVSMETAVPVLVLMLPFLVAAQLFVLAAILHLMVAILARGGRGFGATFEVVCYSTAPDVLLILPYCGGIVAMLWALWVAIVGLREVHRISGASAALAVLLPLLFCAGILVTAIFLASSVILAP
ncbi:MAG: YIP1 family protein [candidate division KSB1 bacterium]|nr:YIP1 family protein [candidate division KSB1 bacterium]